MNKSDFEKEYQEGMQAAKDGLSEDDNPYQDHYHHERDTSYEDEQEYYWYSGFWNYEDNNANHNRP